MSETASVNRAMSALLAELVDGTAPDACWVLNPGDPGLLRSLDRLSAADASAPAPGGGPSIAAHVDHLCYGLELLNRWTPDVNPFADANFSASWRRTVVSDEEWAALRSRLGDQAARWSKVVRGAPLEALGEMELTGMLASIAHLAYHFGAVRQINRKIRGPQAQD